MKALPQAMAIGYIHIGTMAGKLKGVMPATTPERLADRVAVDVGRDVLGELALQELRQAAGELDHLEPAVHLAERVGRDLAVLAGQDRGELLLVLLDAAAGTRTARASGSRARPSRQATAALAGRGHGRVDHLGVGESDAAPAARRWPGS